MASFIFQFEPIIECQTPSKAKYTMHTIAYLSKLVKYDTVGSDLFMTHLNETDVSNRVNVFWSLDWGNLQSIEKIVKDKIVMRKIRKYALKK